MQTGGFRTQSMYVCVCVFVNNNITIIMQMLMQINGALMRTFFYGLNVDWIVARNFHSESSIILVYNKSGDRCWFNGSTTDGACLTSPDAAPQRCRSIHPFFELHPASPLLLPTCNNSYNEYRLFLLINKKNNSLDID